MTVQSRRTLRTKNINSLYDCFCCSTQSPHCLHSFSTFAVKALSEPALTILVMSTLLLAWHGKYADKRINLPFISLAFGLLWALHISLKYNALGHNDYSFLLIALLSVLFIGSIAFANNIIAFTFHSLPPLPSACG